MHINQSVKHKSRQRQGPNASRDWCITRATRIPRALIMQIIQAGMHSREASLRPPLVLHEQSHAFLGMHLPRNAPRVYSHSTMTFCRTADVLQTLDSDSVFTECRETFFWEAATGAGHLGRACSLLAEDVGLPQSVKERSRSAAEGTSVMRLPRQGETLLPTT